MVRIHMHIEQFLCLFVFRLSRTVALYTLQLHSNNDAYNHDIMEMVTV